MWAQQPSNNPTSFPQTTAEIKSASINWTIDVEELQKITDTYAVELKKNQNWIKDEIFEEKKRSLIKIIAKQIIAKQVKDTEMKKKKWETFYPIYDTTNFWWGIDIKRNGDNRDFWDALSVIWNWLWNTIFNTKKSRDGKSFVEMAWELNISNADILREIQRQGAEITDDSKETIAVDNLQEIFSNYNNLSDLGRKKMKSKAIAVISKQIINEDSLEDFIEKWLLWEIEHTDDTYFDFDTNSFFSWDVQKIAKDMNINSDDIMQYIATNIDVKLLSDEAKEEMPAWDMDKEIAFADFKNQEILDLEYEMIGKSRKERVKIISDFLWDIQSNIKRKQSINSNIGGFYAPDILLGYKTKSWVIKWVRSGINENDQFLKVYAEHLDYIEKEKLRKLWYIIEEQKGTRNYTVDYTAFISTGRYHDSEYIAKEERQVFHQALLFIDEFITLDKQTQSENK